MLVFTSGLEVQCPYYWLKRADCVATAKTVQNFIKWHQNQAMCIFKVREPLKRLYCFQIGFLLVFMLHIYLETFSYINIPLSS